MKTQILRLFVALIILWCSLASAQTVTWQVPNIANPDYGFVAQLFNPTGSSETWMITEVNVTGVTFDSGILEWGVGISNTEQGGCTAAPSPQVLNVAGTHPSTALRSSSFPCTGAPLLINTVTAAQCFGNVCRFTQPITVAPGSGISVYTAIFSPAGATANQWHGFASVNFYGAQLQINAAKLAVFMGDSITHCWDNASPGVCPDPIGLPWPNGIDDGLPGDTADGMLSRFQNSVLALNPLPDVVVIECYCNDFFPAGGSETAAGVEPQILSMVNQALAANIRVVLTSTIPENAGENTYFANDALTYDAWAHGIAASTPHVVYADYFDALVDPNNYPNALPGVLTATNGVHPSRQGLQLMAPVATLAIEQALAQ